MTPRSGRTPGAIGFCSERERTLTMSLHPIFNEILERFEMRIKDPSEVQMDAEFREYMGEPVKCQRCRRYDDPGECPYIANPDDCDELYERDLDD